MAMSVRLSQRNAVEAFTSELVSRLKVFVLSMSYATCISSTALSWLHTTKSTSLERGDSL